MLAGQHERKTEEGAIMKEEPKKTPNAQRRTPNIEFRIALYVIGAAFCSTAFARIGETEQQIEARYGKPTIASVFREELGNPMHFYKFHDFLIGVTFENHKSVLEHFRPENHSVMLNAQTKAILGAYGENVWTQAESKSSELPEVGRVTSWLSKDNAMMAMNR
jgi:hypothetical protein